MDGIINVYKEAGYTSHDVVARLRGIFHQKKIGHTGTLDPAAEGVLPVCLGKATKVCDLIMDKSKTYICECKLGIVTETQDGEGKIISQNPVDEQVYDILENVMESFVGEIEQIPPMYSAVKVNGERLYKLAREGKTVDRKPRKINIYDIKIIDINKKENKFTFRVKCSKGTYVRTICHDTGEKLGCGGYMEKLTRERVGIFDIEHALKIDEIQNIIRESGADGIEERLTKTDELFPDLPKVNVTKEGEKYLDNGNPLKQKDVISNEVNIHTGQNVLVYDMTNKFRAIYQQNGKIYKAIKMF